jgi:hypothetical protein
MKITTSYRGVKHELCNDFCAAKLSTSGAVTIQQRHWSDGNKKLLIITIESDELLKTAKSCLQQLSEISGVNYRVSVSLDGGNYRIMES